MRSRKWVLLDPGLTALLVSPARGVDGRWLAERPVWRVTQFDALRLRIVKLAMRGIELNISITLHLSAACLDQALPPPP